MEYGTVVQCTADGLMLGFFYSLMAMGLALIFGIMEVINFAHGEMYMIGAVVIYYIYARFGMSYPLAFIGALLVVGLVGFICERLIFRPLRGQLLPIFIVSLGLAWVLQNSVFLVFGTTARNVPSVFQGLVHFGGATLSVERLMIMVIGAIIIALFFLFIRNTKMGRAMRAVAQDSEAASLQGISIDTIHSAAFAIGCILAASAGALLVPIFSATATMGTGPLFKAFIVVILGGMGSILGAVLGAFIIGFIEAFGSMFVSTMTINIIGFGLVILLLILRPQGLLGR